MMRLKQTRSTFMHSQEGKQAILVFPAKKVGVGISPGLMNGYSICSVETALLSLTIKNNGEGLLLLVGSSPGNTLKTQMSGYSRQKLPVYNTSPASFLGTPAMIAVAA